MKAVKTKDFICAAESITRRLSILWQGKAAGLSVSHWWKIDVRTGSWTDGGKKIRLPLRRHLRFLLICWSWLHHRISANDRFMTIRALANPETKSKNWESLSYFPAQGKTWRRAEKDGHTEAAIDFARLAISSGGRTGGDYDVDGSMCAPSWFKKSRWQVWFETRLHQGSRRLSMKKECLVRRRVDVNMPTALWGF